MPLAPSWNYKRVYITYRSVTTGLLETGRWTATATSRIVNTAADGTKTVFRKGVIASGFLNIVDGANAKSFDVMLPQTDDPDNNPLGGRVKLVFEFDGGSTETYDLDIWAAIPDSTVGAASGGLDLATALNPDTAPDPGPSPLVFASGGGVSSWNDLADKPLTFPPTLGITATTAKVGTYQPAWTDVTAKPTTFTPATHTHTTANVTGLDAALLSKQATINSYASLPVGVNSVHRIVYATAWSALRPSARTDIFFECVGGPSAPSWLITGDSWDGLT